MNTFPSSIRGRESELKCVFALLSLSVAFLLSSCGSGGSGTAAISQIVSFGAIAIQTVGTPLTLEAFATSGLPVSLASTTPSTCTVSGTTASFTASGTCTLQANQTGNSTYAAATPVSQTFTVNGDSQTIAFDPIAAQTVATPLTLSASVASGLAASFASTTPAVCAVSGTTASFIASGTCTIQATQTGNGTYAAAAPVSQTFTVNGETQTIAFGPISAQTVGTPLTLTASVSSSLTATFSSMTPAVCTVSGITATLVAAGACTIQASQCGDSTYAPATAVSQNFAANNPAPAVFGISPNFVASGSAAQNIVLTGANFMPATTATYAGSAHAIGYVNSSAILLPLTAADLTTSGIKAVILANSSPGGGSTKINLPVLYQTDAMLANSQLAAGDQARLQNLIEKGRNGTPVNIAAIGGSITACGGASDSAHCYLFLLQDWWNNTFPSSTGTLIDAGIPGTCSDYGSLRLQRDVLSKNPDLVIVEFAVNDPGNGAAAFGDTYEGLVRQLLDAPSHPAVILLFMSTYRLPVVEEDMTAQPWQSGIGANYNLPMVSYFDAIGPELTDGNIALTDISGDGTHPDDLGHAYTAQFLELNLQNATGNFPAGTAPKTLPTTQAPLYSSDFEFTTLEDGIGANGPALDPAGNQGWIADPAGSDQFLIDPSPGLESSTPGSALDFTVTGKDILLGYWVYNGPMGQASVTVDGVGMPVVLNGWIPAAGNGYRTFTRVANGLTAGPHQVHIDLLSTDDDDGGNTFRLLSVGTGGAK